MVRGTSIFVWVFQPEATGYSKINSKRVRIPRVPYNLDASHGHLKASDVLSSIFSMPWLPVDKHFRSLTQYFMVLMQ